MVPNTKQKENMQLLSISELADEFGIEKDAILFYENKNLLFSGKKRTIGRAYNEFDKFRLKFIINAKNADYALGDIEALIGKIDPARPKAFQIKKLIEYAESKYNQLKRSLDGMDVLEQINTTCDLELLAQYLKDVNTLKSRSAIDEFSRLKLVSSLDEPEPEPASTPDQHFQPEASKRVEPALDSSRVKRQVRGRNLVLAAIIITLVAFFLPAFDGLQPVSWLKAVWEDLRSDGVLEQAPKSSTPTEITTAVKPLASESSQPPISADQDTDPDNLSTDFVSEDPSFDARNQTVMERNSEIFAKVYRNTETTSSPTAKADKTAATQQTDISAESQTDNPSLPATGNKTVSAKSEKTPESAAITAFMKKITASPNQSETPETGSKPTAKLVSKHTSGDKKPTQTQAKKTAPKNPDRVKQAKPKPETKTPVQKKPQTGQTKPVKPKADSVTSAQKPPASPKQTTPATEKKKPAKSKTAPVLLVSPSVVPPILTGGTEPGLKTSPKMQVSKTDTKQPVAPSTDNSMRLLFLDKNVPSELPTDLMNETGAEKEKRTPKKKPAPEALAWIQKSYDHVVSGEAGEAIVAATVAISFDPNVESPYINRAWAYSKKGNHDKAIQDCNKALSINPDSALALNNRGLAYQGKGDIEKAERDYKKACELGLDVACRNYQELTAGDKISNLLEQLEKSQVREDWDTVIRLSTQALSQSPGNVAAYNHRAVAYIQKEFFYKAIKDCNDAIKIDPDNAKSYYNRGNALTRIGNVKVATLDYKKSCDLGLDLGCQILKALK